MPAESAEMIREDYLAKHPPYCVFFGAMGATSAMVFSAAGAAYGTGLCGEGTSWAAVANKKFPIMRSIIPIVMAGIIAIYGLVIAVIIAQSIEVDGSYSLAQSFMHLGAGLTAGLSGLAAGYAVGETGNSGIRALASQPRFFIGMVLLQVFAGVPGLYGLIAGLLLTIQ